MNYDYGKDFDNNEMIFDKNYVENLNNEQIVYSDNLNDNSRYDEEGDKKEGNKFCIISLICYGLTMLISGSLNVISWNIGVFNVLFLGLVIAALTLMIYVRVRYPKNNFGLALMIMYISLIVLPMLFLIALFVLIHAMCSGFNS